MNRMILAPVLLGTSLLGAAQAASVSDAKTVPVTPAIRAQAQQLSKQYTGRACKSDIDLQRDVFPGKLNETQIRSARQAIYPGFMKEVESIAKENNLEYQVRYDHSHIWSWLSKKGDPNHYFVLMTIDANKFDMLSCLN